VTGTFPYRFHVHWRPIIIIRAGWQPASFGFAGLEVFLPMTCDFCKGYTDSTLRVASWQVCQTGMRDGAVARAVEVEFDIAKLQQAVVQTNPMDQCDLQDKKAAEGKLELAHDAYAALMIAMNDLSDPHSQFKSEPLARLKPNERRG
jgi:hypothetical protein